MDQEISAHGDPEPRRYPDVGWWQEQDEQDRDWPEDTVDPEIEEAGYGYGV